uniref:Uncharacterized protein n=1 Tax=Anguilla anguilla TaxID=7936 RepID=A0A0E9UTK2_ANGAN
MNQIQFQFSKAIKTLIKQDAWSFGKDRGRENIINHQGTDLRICFGISGPVFSQYVFLYNYLLASLKSLCH